MGNRIVVMGSANTDMILQMERIPRPGETILGGHFSIAAGGKGANQAVAAARAGGEVTFVARLGNDIFGQQAIEGFAQEGINVNFVLRDEQEPSGVALIFVAEDGENSIGVASGANSRLSLEDIDAARQCIETADVLVMQLETPIETVQHAAEIASAAGVPVILNPAPAQPLSDSLLSQISILTPNESEAELLTGVSVDNPERAREAAQVLHAKGVETVLITLGSQGAVVSSNDFSEHVPAFSVDPIDTTAAGDVYNGALAVALSEGNSLFDAAHFAGAAAALSVTKLGAQPSAPTRTEIEKLLKSS